jgi:hypothetical protein
MGGGEKQIPLWVPRPPNCGGKDNARDSVRDDIRGAFFQHAVKHAATLMIRHRSRDGRACGDAQMVIWEDKVG